MTGAQLDERDVRALTQYLTVLDDDPRVRGADDLYLVVSQSGRAYMVDTQGGACECDDFRYRGGRCKHMRRVDFATGVRPIPDGVEDVDDQLGYHVSGAPRQAATDGGVIVAPDEGEVLDETPGVEGGKQACGTATSE